MHEEGFPTAPDGDGGDGITVSPETPYETRFFSVHFAKNNKINEWFTLTESEAQEFYSVYTDGTKGMRYLVSAEGPNGVALGTPAKGSTNENDYVFTGNWKLGDVEYTPETIKSFIPTGDLTEFYPVYTTSPRKYSIKFLIPFFAFDKLIPVSLAIVS